MDDLIKRIFYLAEHDNIIIDETYGDKLKSGKYKEREYIFVLGMLFWFRHHCVMLGANTGILKRKEMEIWFDKNITNNENFQRVGIKNRTCNNHIYITFISKSNTILPDYVWNYKTGQEGYTGEDLLIR